LRASVGQIFRFGISTVLSAAITVGIPALLHEGFDVEEKAAVAIGQGCALLINFMMVRIFVFRSRRPAQRDIAYYVGSNVVFRGLGYLLFLALFSLAGMFYFTALVLTLAISTLLKFLWYRFIFAEQPEPIA